MTTYSDNAIRTASLLGCTAEQAAALFRANAFSLRKDADKARDTGRRVRGFSADELNRMAYRAETSGQVTTA